MYLTVSGMEIHALVLTVAAPSAMGSVWSSSAPSIWMVQAAPALTRTYLAIMSSTLSHAPGLAESGLGSGSGLTETDMVSIVGRPWAASQKAARVFRARGRGGVA